MQSGLNLPLELPPPTPLPENENFLTSPLISVILQISDFVNFYVTMKVSPDPRKSNASYGSIIVLIDEVIINYGETEKQQQQGHTLSNQSESSLNFNYFPQIFLGKLKIMAS